MNKIIQKEHKKLIKINKTKDKVYTKRQKMK